MNHFQNLLGKSPIVSDSAIEKVEETEKQESCWIKWNSTRSLENWKI